MTRILTLAGSNARVSRVLGILLVIGSLIYLGSGAKAATLFAVFVAGVIVPCAALLARVRPLRDFPPDLRTVISLALVLMMCTFWFFVRRWIPLSNLSVDLTLLVVVGTASYATGSLRRWFDDFLRIARPLAFSGVGVCVAASLIWLGYEVRVGDQVRYYGAFVVDFGNLESVVATIRASPSLPLSLVDGMGRLQYHWFYFAIPAWLADFLGAGMPAHSALMLANLLVAFFFILTLAVAIRRGIDGLGADRIVPAATTIAIFASFTSYSYQWIIRRIFDDPSTFESRNSLLLSLVNSVANFGNNTFALTLAILALALSVLWRRGGGVAEISLAILFAGSLLGYSVTLAFPCLAALGILLMFSGIRRASIAAAAAAVIGSALILIYRYLELVGSGSFSLGFRFDGGMFLLTAVGSMAPLWFLALFGLIIERKVSEWWLLASAAIATASFLYIVESPLHVDFSMKIGSLLAVSLAPPAASGLALMMRSEGRIGPLHIIGLLFICAGFVNSATYVLQFPVYRFWSAEAKSEAVPFEYHQALDYLRRETSPQAIVADGSTLDAAAIYSLCIAERRVFIPGALTDYYIPQLREPLAQRRVRWFAWVREGFGAGELSTFFARGTDYLVIDRIIKVPDEWREVHVSGKWRVYESLARAKRPS